MKFYLTVLVALSYKYLLFTQLLTDYRFSSPSGNLYLIILLRNTLIFNVIYLLSIPFSIFFYKITKIFRENIRMTMKIFYNEKI